MPYVTIRYERTKLYEEVWAEAVTTVAKRYGISDVARRTICKQLAVPLPPLGYWARVAARRKPPTPPLPNHSGAAEIVRERFVSDEAVEPDPELGQTQNAPRNSNTSSYCERSCEEGAVFDSRALFRRCTASNPFNSACGRELSHSITSGRSHPTENSLPICLGFGNEGSRRIRS
jgi:hypothetical protein